VPKSEGRPQLRPIDKEDYVSRTTFSNRSTRHLGARGAPIIILLTFALYVLPQASRWRPEALAAVSPGYVLQIHAIAVPHGHQALDEAKTGNATLDQAKTGYSHADGALTATRNEGSIVFHAILYRADTVHPVAVRAPRLEVRAVDRDRRLRLEPNLPASGSICHSETSWPGHEGPLDACTVYKVPTEVFDDMNLVTLILHFTDAMGPQQRVHSLLAHGLLHMAIGGAPIDMRAVDATITEPTPFVVESLIETKVV
jgi:hypothetical protein